MAQNPYPRWREVLKLLKQGPRAIDSRGRKYAFPREPDDWVLGQEDYLHTYVLLPRADAHSQHGETPGMPQEGEWISLYMEIEGRALSLGSWRVVGLHYNRYASSRTLTGHVILNKDLI